jgi:hypothetical protein
VVKTTGQDHTNKKESRRDDINKIIKKPDISKKNTNKVDEMPLCRPFRTQKLVMAFPVAVATGYTTVPLQGTNLVETTRPVEHNDNDFGKQPGSNSITRQDLNPNPGKGEIV